jgi:DNA (cytosine-5)-methyltransferase 1
MTQLTIAETFVGAGGAHIGFKNEGFETVFVNDIDENMIKTLLKNQLVTENQVIRGTIENITEENIPSNKPIDVLFGGIVCKGFSLAGVRNPFDERNYLYLSQLRLVSIIKPKVSIIENVPSIKTMELYRKCSETIENFKIYSALSQENKNLNGQKSSRRKNNEPYSDLSERINTNKIKMDEILKNMSAYKYNVLDEIKKIYNEMNYTCYEKVLQTSQYGGYTNRKRFFLVAVRSDILKPFVFPSPTHIKENTVNDALQLINYNDKYDIDNLPMKHNTKTIKRFSYIKEGGSIQDVMSILPDDLKISNFYSRGNTQRLNRNLPAPTLVPGHSNFPIHPWENRSITVREAATITGFPTNFQFCGSHSSRCMQIGNAVPIHLARAIARSVKNILE